MDRMITAYHFVGATLRDGRAIPPDGEWLIHDGPVVMCEFGLHASRDPFDALTYAPGETLCMVECEDVVSEDSDKLVCRRRRIVKRRDATAMLREFARAQALSVAHLWDCPPVVRQYLETGDESLRAAASAAAWAASDAAWAAAWAAALASSAAARAAASDAAWAAARAAASDAARAAARADFRRRVKELFA
jgi:hypothetical protein